MEHLEHIFPTQSLRLLRVNVVQHHSECFGTHVGHFNWPDGVPNLSLAKQQFVEHIRDGGQEGPVGPERLK